MGDLDESVEVPFYLAENPVIEAGKAIGILIQMNIEVAAGTVMLYGAHVLGMVCCVCERVCVWVGGCEWVCVSERERVCVCV